MELAGLEPATSWVRFARWHSLPFATCRHRLNDADPASDGITTVCRASSPMLDQNLTKGSPAQSAGYETVVARSGNAGAGMAPSRHVTQDRLGSGEKGKSSGQKLRQQRG